MFSIRDVRTSDAEPLSALIGELGFAVEGAIVAANLEALRRGEAAPLVAEAEGVPIGCLTLNVMPVLHRPAAVGRISMLVVSAGWRGRGVGRALVTAALDRLRGAGCGLCEVTSNEALVDAHAF